MGSGGGAVDKFSSYTVDPRSSLNRIEGGRVVKKCDDICGGYGDRFRLTRRVRHCNRRGSIPLAAYHPGVDLNRRYELIRRFEGVGEDTAGHRDLYESAWWVFPGASPWEGCACDR